MFIVSVPRTTHGLLHIVQLLSSFWYKMVNILLLHQLYTVGFEYRTNMKLLLVCFCVLFHRVPAQNLDKLGSALSPIIKLPYLTPASQGSDSKSNSHSGSNESDLDNSDGSVYDTSKIIASYKYPVEKYSVSTDDGYIIEIQRIPSKIYGKANSVLIFADVLASSVFWVISGPKYGLAFYLANLGYDVWLGNNRGSKYGLKHKILKHTDPAFWYFSIHEWGIYDVPAIIDFILAKAKCKKLSYIGWGYGADQFFVMASEKPEYMKKIKNMQAFAPKVYNQHTRSQIKISAFDAFEDAFYNIIGRFAIIPDKKLFMISGRDRCLKQAIKKEVCNYTEPLVHEGFNIDIPGYPELLNYPLIQGSVRFVLHIIQSIQNGFRHYDHGLASNLLYYKDKCPPKYNITAANVPVAVYYSDYDNISVSKDVIRLSLEVPKLIRAFNIKYKYFSYSDYPLSKVGRKVFYKRVVEVIVRYNY